MTHEATAAGPPRVAVIGASGGVARAMLALLAEHEDVELALFDLDPVAARGRLAGGPLAAAPVGRLDLFDAPALSRAVAGADLVVNGAGPYYRTADVVARACLAAGVAYLDFDDDVESTEAALQLDGAARAAGVAILKGAGASPGLSNVLAAEAAAQLDEVEALDTFWTSGRGEPEIGRAVVEHLIHLAAGPCVVWRGGRRQVVASYEESELLPVGRDGAPKRFWVLSHPEPVMLAHSFPALRSARNLGALTPLPTNGLARGVARAAAVGRISHEDAVRFFVDTSEGGLGPRRAAWHAVGGMLRQVQRGEATPGDVLRYVPRALAGSADAAEDDAFGETVGAIATGTRDGRRTRVIRRLSPDRQTEQWGSTSSSTGRAVAGFVALALAARPLAGGVVFPEAWAEPAALYATLARHGAPAHQLVAPFVEAAA